MRFRGPGQKSVSQAEGKTSPLSALASPQLEASTMGSLEVIKSSARSRHFPTLNFLLPDAGPGGEGLLVGQCLWGSPRFAASGQGEPHWADAVGDAPGALLQQDPLVRG